MEHLTVAQVGNLAADLAKAQGRRRIGYYDISMMARLGLIPTSRVIAGRYYLIARSDLPAILALLGLDMPEELPPLRDERPGPRRRDRRRDAKRAVSVAERVAAPVAASAREG